MTIFQRKPDPRIRKDGKCSVCGHSRPELAIAHHDPFCSTQCAKKWHGVKYAGTVTSQ